MFMGVQKSRRSRARQGTRQAHNHRKLPNILTQLSEDKTSGELHRRHHLTKDGYYRGKKIIYDRIKDTDSDSDTEE
jgi:large subunit ribosomal protein L32